MKPIISLLLGSGFSIPEGLPSTSQLNQRMSMIGEDEILIHTDQTAIFLNGQEDRNRWSGRDERLFLQEFLKYYSKEVLKPGEEFHYETFYDFYSGYLTNNENAEAIEKFWKDFNEKYLSEREHVRDCYNRISDFNRSYNQLLASQLHRSQYFNDINTSDYPPFDAFIRFLKNKMKDYDIKIHTLNHDLFMDWLGHNHGDIWQYFSDGFQLEGSPFYGSVSYDFNQNSDRPIVHKTYMVKLEHYVNNYNKPICLFKLHGSIFNIIVYLQRPEQRRVRLKSNYAVSRFHIEFYDEKSNEHHFDNLHDEAAPDFLSGTTNKTRYYTKDPYYVNLFEHFERNLNASDTLIVIGYGFKDYGINEYLEKHFLSRGGKMIVISPHKPDSDLLDKYNAIFVGKGITEMRNEDYIRLFP
jgi:hypothetical protein